MLPFWLETMLMIFNLILMGMKQKKYTFELKIGKFKK
jgi:hypothetical protein